MIVVLWLISRSPMVFPVAAGSPPATHPLSPLMLSVYVPTPRLIVEPGLAFASWTAPRRLQSLAAAVQADAAVSPAPAGSSKRSTVTLTAAAIVTSFGAAPPLPKTTTPRAPFTAVGSGSTAVAASTAVPSEVDAAARLRDAFRGTVVAPR